MHCNVSIVGLYTQITMKVSIMNRWESRLLKFLGTIFLLLVIALIVLTVRSATQRMIALMPTPTGYEDEFFALRLVAPDLPRGYKVQRILFRVKEKKALGMIIFFGYNRSHLRLTLPIGLSSLKHRH